MAKHTSRSIIASNLRRMIDGTGQSVRAWAMQRGLDVRMIDRLTKGEHAVTIDKLEEIAAVLGLQAWQLMLPDLDMSSPPEAPISEEDRRMLQKLRRLLNT